jgi:hypothetical protein
MISSFVMFIFNDYIPPLHDTVQQRRHWVVGECLVRERFNRNAADGIVNIAKRYMRRTGNDVNKRTTTYGDLIEQTSALKTLTPRPWPAVLRQR